MTDTTLANLLLVDISGLFAAHWHIGASDAVNEAARRTVGVVRRYILDSGDHAADRVVLCCDGPSSRASRVALDPTYKAQRPPADRLMLGQLKSAIEQLGRDGCHLLTADGYEADDVIATVVRWARSTGWLDVVIMSDDKDMAQLVCDAPSDEGCQVRIYRPRQSAMLDETAVRERWGVAPSQMGDYLALCGDSSDNVPGVKGVGHKTAVKLLAKWDSLDGLSAAVISRATEFTPALAENLRASMVGGLVAANARALVALHDDVLTPEQLEAIRQEKPMQPTTPTDTDETPDATWSEPDAAPQPAPSEPKQATFTAAPAAPAAIVLHPDAPWQHALEPTDLRSTYRLAAAAFESRLFSAYGNPEAVMMAIVMGRELGLPAMTALRAIHIIKGKPCMSAQLIQGLCEQSKACRYFALIESTNESATYETHREGHPAPVRMSWSIEDAKTAGLLNKGGNWNTYPRTMLRWRCVAELARAVYPDVTMGVYTAEELSE